MSAQTSFSSRLRTGGTFSEKERVSIIERAKRRAHNSLLGLFEKKLKSEAITVAEIARRIGKDQSRVSRTLNYSSNSTIETLALIAAAMGKDIQIQFPDFSPKRNYSGLQSRIAVQLYGNNFKLEKGTDDRSSTMNQKNPSGKRNVQQNKMKAFEDA